MCSTGLGIMTEAVPTSTPRVRVLVVEDDPEVIQAVRNGLDARRFSFESAPTVAAGREQLAAGKFDVLILDLSLPDGSGLELADELRGAGSDVPILMLTARSGVQERVDGFRHGADDYVCKPFAIAELEARLGAVLRRSRPARPNVLTYADLEFDLLHREVRRGDSRALLSAREADLLAYFLRHADEHLPRSRILEEVWGNETEFESNVVNVYVNYLRNKLEQGRNPRLIHTVRGVGYVLSAADPDALD